MDAAHRVVISAPTIPARVRVVTAAGTALVLEARYGEGPHAAAVVAPPHPLYGGTLDNPVVVGTALALRNAGLATLTFNYRGVEASEGAATDSLEAAVDDYRAALAELTARAAGPYLAAGYSFGAGAALLAARDDARVAGVVLIAPPLGLLHEDDLRALAAPLLVIVGDDDEYAPAAALQEKLAVRPDASLIVIANESHFFHYGGLAELGRCVTNHVREWV